MKLSKKALTIIDMQQYRAYGLGYLQAVDDMRSWFTASLPGVVMSELAEMGCRASRSLDRLNEYHRADVSGAARELLAETHEMLGVDA